MGREKAVKAANISPASHGLELHAFSSVSEQHPKEHNDNNVGKKKNKHFWYWVAGS